MIDAAAQPGPRVDAYIAGLRHELHALEEALLHPLDWPAALRAKRLLYVGGRPGSNTALRALVEQAGGEFVLYAGLIDDDGSRPEFAVLLQHVDLVCCPLDLIDHDSLAALRRLCARHGVPWRALRSASVASFVAGLSGPPPAGPPPRAASRSCPRHG